MANPEQTTQEHGLAQLLTEAREAAGLTQVQLALRLRRPQSFVSKVESGERRIDVIELLEIADEVGADVGNLIRSLLAVRA